MKPAELERYLHVHIPLSAAMAVAVISVDEEAVLLRAPLGPNINHRDTVFGGSASALATLAAWSLLHIGLDREGIASRIVVQRNTIECERPILGEFKSASNNRDVLVVLCWCERSHAMPGAASGAQYQG